jgi:hypothetical protein
MPRRAVLPNLSAGRRKRGGKSDTSLAGFLHLKYAVGSQIQDEVIEMKKSKKQTSKRSTKSAAAELTYRLGPSREVTKMMKAKQTKNSYVLTLSCGHKRVATKRATLRCRRCAKRGK